MFPGAEPVVAEGAFFVVQTSAGELEVHRYEVTRDGTEIEPVQVDGFAAGAWRSFHMDAPSEDVQELVRKVRERADKGTGMHI